MTTSIDMSPEKGACWRVAQGRRRTVSSTLNSSSVSLLLALPVFSAVHCPTQRRSGVQLRAGVFVCGRLTRGILGNSGKQKLKLKLFQTSALLIPSFPPCLSLPPCPSPPCPSPLPPTLPLPSSPPSLASSSTYLHQLPDLLVEVDLGHFRLSLPYDKDRLSPPTTLSPRVRLLGADLRSPISDLHAVRCVDLRRSTRGNSVEIAEKRQGREGAKGREEEKGEGGRGREREKAAVK